MGILLRIIEDHFEEISVLASQRRAYLRDPEMSLGDVLEFENRLLAHIEGFLANGDEALRLAATQLSGDDFEDVHAAALAVVFSEDPGAGALLSRIGADAADEQKTALIDAMCLAPAGHVLPSLETMIAVADPVMRAGAVRVAGYRRSGDLSTVVGLLDDSDPSVRCAAAKAIGTLSDGVSAAPVLQQVAEYGDPGLRRSAIVSLLRLGRPSGLALAHEMVRGDIGDASDLPVYLGVAGGQKESLLLQAGARNAAIPYITALGYLGDIGAVPALLSLLSDEDIPDDARNATAAALQRITGADLFVTTTQIVEEDWGNGEIEHDEITQTRPTLSHAEWSAWWQDHRGRFEVSRRYRGGELFSLSNLLAFVAGENSRMEDRRWGCLELAIRTGRDAGYEPDGWIADQRAAFALWRGLIENTPALQVSGTWSGPALTGN